MRLKAGIAATAILFAAATAFAMATSPALAKHACYSQRIKSDWGVAFKKSHAREKARKSWNKKAQKATGTTRVNWKWAQGQEWSCTKPALRWKCIGWAYPCVS